MYVKKIEYKPLILTVALIAFQSLCYFISKLLGGNPTLIGGVIDNKIPFNIWFIIPYCIWYLLIFLIPYYLYKKDKNIFTKYFLAYSLSTFIANIIFIAYPTCVDRPIVTGTSLIELMTRIVFWIDTPAQNCFPSLHCAVSMLFILYMFECKKAPMYLKILTTIMSILIMMATLFTKQHVFIDLVSGDILAIISYIIVGKFKKTNKKVKELLAL